MQAVMFPDIKLHKASLIIFDLDGTLYDQRLLRFRMSLLMARELIWTSAGRRKIKILACFRKLRENLAEAEADNIINLQYSEVASRLSVSMDEVKAVTDDWLLHRPLPLLRGCRAPYADQFFKQLRQAGKLIAVLSDYPAQDKLNTLELDADLVVAATDLEVNRFKPHPKGLFRVLALAKMNDAGQCLVIGDREERDGECAKRAGAPFILKKQARHTSQPGISCYSELLKQSPLIGF